MPICSTCMLPFHEGYFMSNPPAPGKPVNKTAQPVPPPRAAAAAAPPKLGAPISADQIVSSIGDKFEPHVSPEG